MDLRGTAYEFNKPAKRLAGATVRVAERPKLRATVRKNGAYRLAVPDRARVTPYVDAPGYHRIYLQTFTTAGKDLDRVNFQVPTDGTYNALATLLKVPLDAKGDIRAVRDRLHVQHAQGAQPELQRLRPLRRPRRGGRHRLGHAGPAQPLLLQRAGHPRSGPAAVVEGRRRDLDRGALRAVRGPCQAPEHGASPPSWPPASPAGS